MTVFSFVLTVAVFGAISMLMVRARARGARRARPSDSSSRLQRGGPSARYLTAVPMGPAGVARVPDGDAADDHRIPREPRRAEECQAQGGGACRRRRGSSLVPCALCLVAWLIGVSCSQPPHAEVGERAGLGAFSELEGARRSR